MSSLRLPLRLARREVRRRPGRTALVALLVALPVAGMAMAVTLVRTDARSLEQRWTESNGQADATWWGMDPDTLGLPEGSRVVSVSGTFARVKTADGTRAGVEVSDLPLDDPMAAGIHDLVAGRAPAVPGEVVLSARLADRLGVRVGEELVLERPPLTLTLVGEVESRACLGCGTVLFAPGALPDALLGPGRAVTDGQLTLIDLPDDLILTDLAALHEDSGGPLRVRAFSILPAQDDENRGDAVRWTLVIGALVLTVAGIVISAAFAVGARRQLVTLGQLSASGASPATIRTALVLQGTLTGLVGALGGLALAAALLLLGQPLVEVALDRRLDGYRTRVLEIVAVVVIGVVSATVAALIPARTAARVPTLAALAGRRPLAPVSRRLVSLGLVSMAGGLALLFLAVLGSREGSSGDLWALVAIVGGVAELLGACAIAPALVSRLEPLAHRLRGSLRLGARSLARNRARTGAVVSAVCAAGALAVAAGGLILGAEASAGIESSLPDDVILLQQAEFDERTGVETVLPVDAQVKAAVRDAVPSAQAVELRGVAPVPDDDPHTPAGWEVRSNVAGDQSSFGINTATPFWDRAVLADDDLLDALRAGDEVRDALDETGVVALATHGGRNVEGAVTVILPDGREVQGVSVVHQYSPGYSSGILLTDAAVADLGLEVEPLGTMFRTQEPLTAEERGQLEDLQYDLHRDAGSVGGVSKWIGIQWVAPPSGPSTVQLELILSGVALVFSLFVVGVSLALAAAESKDERDILTIAGAPPGTLARSAGARAWLLAALGAAMAVPVGFLPVVVFARAQSQGGNEGFVNESFPLVFPTRTVLLLLVAVPLIVALVAWFSSSAAQRFRPVRVSTAVFE